MKIYRLGEYKGEFDFPGKRSDGIVESWLGESKEGDQLPLRPTQGARPTSWGRQVTEKSGDPGVWDWTRTGWAHAEKDKISRGRRKHFCRVQRGNALLQGPKGGARAGVGHCWAQLHTSRMGPRMRPIVAPLERVRSPAAASAWDHGARGP